MDEKQKKKELDDALNAEVKKAFESGGEPGNAAEITALLIIAQEKTQSFDDEREWIYQRLGKDVYIYSSFETEERTPLKVLIEHLCVHHRQSMDTANQLYGWETHLSKKDSDWTNEKELEKLKYYSEINHGSVRELIAFYKELRMLFDAPFSDPKRVFEIIKERCHLRAYFLAQIVEKDKLLIEAAEEIKKLKAKLYIKEEETKEEDHGEENS